MPILYSCCTELAFLINEEFYRGAHYVYCTRHFDPTSAYVKRNKVPPSSNPFQIYSGLKRDVEGGDKHSGKIRDNKSGILRGAEVRFNDGVITESQRADIYDIVEAAEVFDFRPLILVIAYSRVKRQLQPVKRGDRAHPLSAEYIIPALKENSFDVIVF